MGTVPILAANIGYQFGPTNRNHPELGDYNQRARVLDICSGPTTQCIRGLAPIVRKALVSNILAANAGHQFGPTKRNHPELGDYNQSARILDIRSGPAIKCTRGLSPVVRKTMVADDIY